MNNSNINLIYLLGAGRSGTTLLTALLNSHKEIESLGEMNQFFEFLELDKNCSCGKNLKLCSKWNLEKSLTKNLKEKRKYCEKLEKHKNIPFLLIKKNTNKKYNEIQKKIFVSIKHTRPSQWYLDSSKYIARYLLLRNNKNFNAKAIYLVRDPRGVIFSFKKNVQTSKNALSSIAYYNFINFFAEIVFRKDKNILKIRYEDLVEYPVNTLSIIYEHIFEKQEQVTIVDEYYKMPHIVGGNRIKENKQINLKIDYVWKNKTARYKQIIYYYLCLPFTLINKYKL